MQLVLYIAPPGSTLPDHAKVIEIAADTAESQRAGVHGAVDALVNDIKAGWIPPVLTPADTAAEADAAVVRAKADLAAAEKAAAEAHKAADAAAAEAAEPDNQPAKPVVYTGAERRTATSKRRLTDTGNPSGANRRTGPADRRTPAQA